MKKVFVTGVAGFIGYHVACSLLEEGIEVIGVDNFNPYYSLDLKVARIAMLKKEGLLFFEEDICNTPHLIHLLQRHKVTHLLHLAAQAGVRYALTHPHAYVKNNLEGFASVLEAAKESAIERLVYASSSSVYTNRDLNPKEESSEVNKPNNFYAASKRCNELMAHAYTQLYPFKAIGLRFFTVYGPWGRPDMAYYLFTDASTHGRPIPLFNEGKMVRDFTYVSDIVKGVVAALKSECGSDLFNLGLGAPRPLMSMISHLERKLGVEARFEYRATEGEAESTCADITKAREILNYNPTISLEEGLDHFIEWYVQYGDLGLPKEKIHEVTSR